MSDQTKSAIIHAAMLLNLIVIAGTGYDFYQRTPFHRWDSVSIGLTLFVNSLLIVLSYRLRKRAANLSESHD
jgi:hypothetical protein